MIDPGDAVFSRLRIWIDKNHNGVCDPSELYTLRQIGVSQIDLKYTLSPYVDAYGNQFRYKGRIWDAAGIAHSWSYDVTLLLGSFVTGQ